MNKIRILIADPHELFREGLRRLINGEKDLSCVATIGDAESLFKIFSELIPDVVLLDSCLSEDIAVLIRSLKSINDSARLIVLTHSTDEGEIQACFQAGVDGYLTKDETQTHLMNAIRTVYGGEQVLCPVARLSISHLIAGKDEIQSELYPVSKRELEVITMVGKGMTNREIAIELNITEHTVASHCINIFRKLEVRSRTEAVLHCMQRGWIVLCDHNRS